MQDACAVVPVNGLDLAPLAASLLVPLVIPLVVSHKQMIEVKEIIDPQWVHSLNQDLLLTKEWSRAMIRQREGVSSKGGILLERCWVQVVLHEGQQQQQEVMGVRKRRSGSAVVIMDEMSQEGLEYIGVILVLPSVGG